MHKLVEISSAVLRLVQTVCAQTSTTAVTVDAICYSRYYSEQQFSSVQFGLFVSPQTLQSEHSI